MQSNGPVPLEQKTISIEYNGVQKEVPAIDRWWVTERAFPMYIAPPVAVEGGFPVGAKETWLELMALLQEDLCWLLAQPHHIFWSQMLLTKAPILSLTAFLQEAPPAYCLMQLQEPAMDAALQTISRLVFLTYCRLCTIRENKEDFLSKQAFGKLIYDNYLITIPSMFDLCAIYGPSNKDGVRRILVEVTTAQPKYLDDLGVALNHYLQVLDRAKTALPQNSWSGRVKDLGEVLLQIADALPTLNIFLQLLPKGCEVFACAEFISSLASFYSSVIPLMGSFKQFLTMMQLIRSQCIKVVRTLFEDLMHCAVELEAPELVEKYLSLTAEMMSEAVFVMDYHAIFPLDVDLAVIADVCPDMDHMKIDYLLEALCSHVDLAPTQTTKSTLREDEAVAVNYPHTKSSVIPGPSSTVTRVQLESLITQVQDILPHLGSSFVEACLRYYDYSSEKVVASVLEGSLPSSLEMSNWEEQNTPREVASCIADEEPVDVAFRGKKPKRHKNANQLLNDKSDLIEMKERFDALRFVEDTTYDDEYDDTYESEKVEVQEADGWEAQRRPFVTPRVLQQERRNRYEENEEEEEETESECINKDIFIVNPEELRAKAAQRRAELGGRRDVVGRSKGQGQDKQVLVNRAKKNVHKAGRANHHRRDGAQRKRNHGMIPS